MSAMPSRRRARTSCSPSRKAPEKSGAATLQHQLLDLADRLRRIQAFRAGARAIHDGVAAVELERILEIVEARTGVFIARVDDPAIRLQQHGGAKVAVAIPPVARATGRATRAENAF